MVNKKLIHAHGTIENVLETVFSRYSREAYIPKVDFHFYTDITTSTHYIIKFKSTLPYLTKYDLKMEISQYKWLYELSEYFFGGDEFDPSREKEYEIESQLFQYLNLKDINKKAFEILEYLKNIDLNKLQQNMPFKSKEFEFIMRNLIGFTKDHNYEYTKYKTYVNDFLESFDRITQAFNDKQIQDLIQEIRDDINLTIEIVVCQPVTSERYKLKTNYYKIKDLVLNALQKYSLNDEQPQQIVNHKPDNPKKTLFQFMQNIENKEAFFQDLKKTFPNEKGKNIKAILIQLQKATILNYGSKEFKQLYNELQRCFDRNIGTYAGINDPKEKDIDNTINENISNRLNPLILKYKKI